MFKKSRAVFFALILFASGGFTVNAGGRMLVSVREIFETMGFETEWNGETRQATFTRANNTVVLTVDEAVFTVNGITRLLDVPPRILGGRMMLPFGSVLEIVGYYMDGASHTEHSGEFTVVTVVPPRYEEVANFSEGLAAVRVGEWDTGFWGVIDTEGREVIPPVLQYDGISIRGFREGLLAVRVGDLWGFIDTTGREVVSPRYGSRGFMPEFREGFAAVRVGDRLTGLWGFIDATGREIVPPVYDRVHWFSNGFAAVEVDGLWGFIDTTGREEIPPQYNDVYWRGFTEGLAAVRVGDLWGFIDTEGREIVPPRYDNALSFSEGRAAVRVGDLWGFINTAGREVVPPRYDAVGGFHERLSVVRVGDLSGVINASGREIVPPRYEYIMPFSEGLAIVMVDDLLGFIDAAGREVVPPRYDEAWEFREGRALVMADGLWGFIDTTGREIMPPQFANVFIDYDSSGGFYNGVLFVYHEESGFITIIDTFGREVVSGLRGVGQYRDMYDGLLPVQWDEDGLWGVIRIGN